MTMECYIRPLKEEDLQKRVDWINSPWIHERTGFAHPVTLEQTKAWFEGVKMDSSKAHFVICEKETGLAVGMAGLLGIHAVHRHGELYVSIGEPAFAGKGLARKAVEAVLGYAFQERHLEKVVLHTYAFNTPAIRLYEGCGFMLEGRFRKHEMKNGVLQDVLHYGLLKEEWEK